MLKNVDKFNEALGKYAKTEAPEDVHRFLKLFVFELLNRTVDNTPVNTGTLRGGWQVTINEKPKPVTRVDADGSKVKQEEGLKIEGMEFGAQVFVSNLVEYAEFVEFGTERMAARHMLQNAFDELLLLFP